MTNRSDLVATLKRLYLRRYLSGILFACLTVIALFVALQQFYIINLNSATRYNIWWHISFNLFYFWYWIFWFPVLYAVATKLRIGNQRSGYWITVYFLIPVGIVIVHQVLASAVISLLLGYSDFPTLVYKRILRNPWIGLDFIVYFVILIAINVVEYRQRNKEDELSVSRLQAQVVQSQLNALESQLHPHFLFNAMNTISTLILKEENAEAGRMLSLLSEFLKTTIYSSDRHETTLEHEMQFIGRYLEIERVRFSDRLEVRQKISPATLNAVVPNFLLQPIVENAVRYGVAPRITKGIIGISSRTEDGRQLEIDVEDNGPGLPGSSGKIKEGVGLKVTRQRLGYLFGERHRFELGKSSLGGMKVTIVMPLIEGGPAHAD